MPASKITQDVAFRLWEMFILLLTWSWLSSSWQELRIFRQHGDYNTSLPDVQWQEGPWSTAKAGCDKKGFNNTTYSLQNQTDVFKSRRKFVNDAWPASRVRPRWAPRTSTPSPSLTSRWTPLYIQCNFETFVQCNCQHNSDIRMRVKNQHSFEIT